MRPNPARTRVPESLVSPRGVGVAILSRVDDTHPEAARVQIELLRRAGPVRRSSIALRLSSEVVARSRRALEGQPGDARLRWVELWYGADLAQRVREYLAKRE